MVAPYPAADETALDEAAERDWAIVQNIISGIRNVRNEYKVEPGRWVAATVAAGGRAAMLSEQRALIVRLARVADEQLAIVERLDAKPAQAAALVVGDVEVYLPLAGLIDLAAERARLGKELEQAEAENVTSGLSSRFTLHVSCSRQARGTFESPLGLIKEYLPHAEKSAPPGAVARRTPRRWVCSLRITTGEIILL